MRCPLKCIQDFACREPKIQNAEKSQRDTYILISSTELCQGPVLYKGFHKEPRTNGDHEGLENSVIILTALYLVEQCA